MSETKPESFAPHVERVQANDVWVRHFRQNRERDWRIPWESALQLSDAEHRRIARSIGEFQRGESSEARHYLDKSEIFAARTGDPAFHAASLLFVREENEHAALLGRFMDEVGIPRRRSTTGDAVFRRLRARSDLGWTSRVLIVGELIAQEYYPCLHAATRHPALRRICDKVIRDEDDHIRFQVERIVRLEAALGPVTLGVRDHLQGILMEGAAFVVYASHRHVLGGQMGYATFRARAVARNRAVIAALRRFRHASSFGLARDAIA